MATFDVSAKLVVMNSLPIPDEQAQKHRHVLLSQQRCSECAERIPPNIILTGGKCPECDTTLGNQLADDAMSVLHEKWKHQRSMVYSVVAILSFMTGLIPMLQSLAMVVILVYLHINVIRKPLRWLSGSRRVAVRFSIKILAAGMFCFSLVCNILVIPLVGASALVLAALSLLQVVIYCECSLKLIDQRLEWESAGERLKVREWLFPSALITGTLAMVGAGLGLTSLVLYMLTETDIPGVAEIARFILDA